MRTSRHAKRIAGSVTIPATGSNLEPVGPFDEPPVQLSRALVDAAIARGMRNIRKDSHARVTRQGSTMQDFLRHARAIQNLPSFGRRMRE